MSFEGYYHQDVHDAMLAYLFDGKKKKWTFSLYTTNDEVDILSVATKLGGGGHKKACGFQLDPEMVHFKNNKPIEIGINETSQNIK